jgi:NADH-quinone oxidoreductase subunit M
MILQGAYSANRVWAYWAVSGVVLGAAYLLWLYQRVFWGKVTNEENLHLKDLDARELATLVPLVALCAWIGVYPKPFLDFLHRPVAQIADTIQPGKFTGGAALAAAPAGTAAHPATAPGVPERSEAVEVKAPAPSPSPGPGLMPERAESVEVKASPGAVSSPAASPSPAH